MYVDGSGPLSIEVLLIYWLCPIVVKSLFTLCRMFVGNFCGFFGSLRNTAASENNYE